MCLMYVAQRKDYWSILGTSIMHQRTNIEISHDKFRPVLDNLCAGVQRIRTGRFQFLPEIVIAISNMTLQTFAKLLSRDEGIMIVEIILRGLEKVISFKFGALNF